MDKKTSECKEENGTALKNQPLINNDWIYKRIEKFHFFQVLFMAMFVYCLVYVIVGFSMDYLYDRPDVLYIHDTAEWVNGINVWVFFLPLCWAVYKWAPEAHYNTIQSLEDNELLASRNDSQPNFEKLSLRLKRGFENLWIYRISFVGAIIADIFLVYFFVPSSTALLGKVDFWYSTSLSYTIITILFSISCYIIFVMLLRQLISVWSISNFFRQANCIENIFPLHPDGCGGFSEIGDYIIKMALVVVAALVWQLILAYFPVLDGGKPLGLNLLIVNILYFIFVPVLVIVPLWYPHIAMLHHKRCQLKHISEELLSIMNQSVNEVHSRDFPQLASNVDRAKKLEELYKTLDGQIPTWPINFKILRTVGISTSFPFLISLLVNAVDIFKIIKAIPYP